MCSEASGDRETSVRASSLSWVTKVGQLGQSVLGARIISLVPVLLNHGVGRVHHGQGMVLSTVCVWGGDRVFGPWSHCLTWNTLSKAGPLHIQQPPSSVHTTIL